MSAADRTLLASMLESGPRRDIDDISERLRRGRWPLLQRSSWQVYDQYLKANRVEAGVRSYGLVVTLILRAQFDEEWRPGGSDPGSGSGSIPDPIPGPIPDPGATEAIPNRGGKTIVTRKASHENADRRRTHRAPGSPRRVARRQWQGRARSRDTRSLRGHRDARRPISASRSSSAAMMPSRCPPATTRRHRARGERRHRSRRTPSAERAASSDVPASPVTSSRQTMARVTHGVRREEGRRAASRSTPRPGAESSAPLRRDRAPSIRHRRAWRPRQRRDRYGRQGRRAHATRGSGLAARTGSHLVRRQEFRPR